MGQWVNKFGEDDWLKITLENCVRPTCVSRISLTSELYEVLVFYMGLGISREPWKLGCLQK